MDDGFPEGLRLPVCEVQMALHPVILAGGSGTRLWPLSRQNYPKQFLALSGSHSMLQETVIRLHGLDHVARPIIVCNEEHRFLVAEQTHQIGVTPLAIILEPVGRNTAPALTLAALALIDLSVGADSEDPVMLVMPSDHLVRDTATFQSTVNDGVSLAESGRLVTFGVVPAFPETGYGYIKKGDPLPDAAAEASSFLIDSFIEKPDSETAQKMLESDDYLWNSGIFMMRSSVWLEELDKYHPGITEACSAAYAQGQKDGAFYRPDAELFAACTSDSIDYSVMEKASGGTRECAVLPLDVGWSDVGSWSALWDEEARDKDGNIVWGDVYAHSMHNSLLFAHNRLLAAVGLDDTIVVETADAVLVAHKNHVQEVKAIVARLKEERRPEQENHRKVHRPWGAYENIDSGPNFQVKRLTVNPGAALSLQIHEHRAEYWVVVKGTAKVTKGDEEFLLNEGQSTDVPRRTKHRLENPGDILLEIIEVQSGRYLGEDDIVRFDDRYNRHKSDQSSREP